MGDRANVYCVEEGSKGSKGLYLYTHWAGSELPEAIQTALAKRWRWNDGAYLNRIIFDVMCPEVGETGFGISLHRCDNEHAIIVVDCDKQTVGYANEGEEPKCFVVSWTFEEFIKLTKKQLYAKYF